ncbi:MAG: hypothetical protein KAU24_00610, partial [Candidatus Aenigmarchaeota archaeon]|nr:hypothetical protein [Candidatus Aenigmarchaeota archaeon]
MKAFTGAAKMSAIALCLVLAVFLITIYVMPVFANTDCSTYTEQGPCEDAECWWCPDCADYYIFNGPNQCVPSATDCSYDGCSISCGAQCDAQTPCPDTECDDLDDCYGVYRRDYSDVPNACLFDCTCEQNTCDDYTENCDILCGAECETSEDCSCPISGCVGNDWYEYPGYGTCLGDCTCDTGTGQGEPC